MKKLLIIFTLVIFFLIGFSFSTMVFSEEEISMGMITNNNGKNIIKLFTPSNIESIYLEIYNNEALMVAGVHLDYYSLERVNGRRKNTFVFNRDYISNKDSTVVLFPGSEREVVFNLDEIEIVNSDSDFKDNSNLYNIKAMSFNIHHGKNRLGFNNLNDVAKTIKENGVDVVGLQEVDKNVYRSKFNDQVKILANELGMYYAFGPNIKIMGMEYGNAVLSKYPIESIENVQLPGLKEKRGLLVTKINIETKTINFLVTHLGLTKQERTNQVKLIRKYLDFLGNKTVLVGDFNSNENSNEINLIKEVMKDAAEEGDEAYKHTYDGLVIKSRIDYIFVSPDVKIDSYKVLDSNASDHFPLIVDLEL